MPAGLGGGGYVALTFETTLGTYLPPSTAGTVFVPILEESLNYTEDRYISPQIRQQTIASEVKAGYYHVEGDITIEADPAFLPYFLYASRHAITKTGAGPFVYKFVPSQAGSASTAASGAVPRTLSIAVIRNGIGFGYAGCVVTRVEATIEDGILKFTFGILGVSETTPGALGTPTWAAANLYGADASSVFVDASGLTPAFATADLTFNGFTFTADYNGEAQNRINPQRSASYISFGETEATYDTELDFLSKAEYDNFKAVTTRAIRLLSVHPSGSATVTAATDAVQIDVNRSVYETYDVSLPGMGDLIMAGVTGRAVGIAGGDAYSITVKSAATIT